jgi:phage anti-repressor protein
MNDLIPIAVADVGGQSIQTVNLRDLHEGLGVGRDFSTWAKERIAKYGFVEGQDFVISHDLISPVSGSSKARDRETIEYHASIDMAKELAMVENTDKGRAVRRYFIEVEKQFKAMVLPDLSDPVVLQQLLADHVTKRIEAEKRAVAAEKAVEAVKPKAEFYDRFANADGLYGLQNAARVLNQPPNKFISTLKQASALHCWAFCHSSSAACSLL